MKNQVKLGDLVKDTVTGFKGIAIADITYYNGCRQICIKPKMKKGEVKMGDGEYVDIQQVKVIKSKTQKVERKATGGPQRDCPSV